MRPVTRTPRTWLVAMPADCCCTSRCSIHIIGAARLGSTKSNRRPATQSPPDCPATMRHCIISLGTLPTAWSSFIPRWRPCIIITIAFPIGRSRSRWISCKSASCQRQRQWRRIKPTPHRPRLHPRRHPLRNPATWPQQRLPFALTCQVGGRMRRWIIQIPIPQLQWQ